MAFGFGVGDFLAVIELADEVCGAYRDAPGQFQAISDEVLSLQLVLSQTKDVYDAETTSQTEKDNLKVITDGCTNALVAAQDLLAEYNRYGHHRILRFWRRVTWDNTKVNELRGRFDSNVGFLTAFNSNIIV
jgi:hypothetical protein